MSELRSQLQEKTFSIVHIEDQYIDLKWVANEVRNWLLKYVMDRDDNLLVENTKLTGTTADGFDFEQYQFSIDEIPSFGVSYLFVDAPALPPEFINDLARNKLFILDVLRPDDEGKDLKSGIDESYRSIRDLCDPKDVVCFTAYQGQLVEINQDDETVTVLGDDLRLIGKSSSEDLDDLVKDKLMEWLQDV